MRTALLGTLLIAATALTATGMASAADKPSFTAAQADAGKKLYLMTCARGCHLDNMGGSGPAPALAGNDFMVRWEGEKLSKLWAKVSKTMPKSAPGSLDDSDYENAIAYILSQNGFMPGAAPFKGDSPDLDKLEIEK